MCDTDILIVEDERIVAEDIKSTLLELGYGVCGIAPSGQKALATIERRDPDLVLMDIVLQGELNGIETTEKLQGTTDVPVVYLSAYGDNSTIERAKKTTPFGYIMKPFEDNELRSAIETALYRHKMESKVSHLNAILRAIRNVNQLITQEKNRSRLLEKSCHLLIETRGFHDVWIVLVDRDDSEAGTTAESFTPCRPYYSAGLGAEFSPMEERLDAGELPKCARPALENDAIQTTTQPARTCSGCPLANVHEETGALTTSLRHGDRIHGWICAAVPREYVSDTTEHELFAEVAGDIAYALSALEAEEELRFQSMLLDQIQDLITATDLEGRIKYVNEAETRMFDVPREELIGKTVFEFGEDDQKGARQQEILEKTRENGHWRGEVVNYDGDGNERILDCRTRTVKDDSGNPIALCGISTDITERKRAEEELRRMQKLESLGTVAGGIAHDFNNLLMGVFGNIELAKSRLPADDDSRNYLEEANKALESARQLTGQLLTFAKGGDPVLKTVNMARLIRDTVEFNLSGSNVSSHHDIVPDLWPVKADRGQMGQVIANLTINAKQAMPSGGALHVRAENVPEAECQSMTDISGPCVRLTMRDEGTGIPPKIVDRIFDPYFTTKQTGRGLGLAVTHSIIEKHGGRINVDSVSDIGTTFTVLLPADTSETIQLKTCENEAERNLGPESASILLMDDEVTVRKAASKMMETCGYEVDTVPDGRNAVEKYAEAQDNDRPYDLVILDLTVPAGMGGKKTVQEILSIHPDARVIVTSGYSSDPVLANYADYGFCGKLAKPFEMETLKREISRVLVGE